MGDDYGPERSYPHGGGGGEGGGGPHASSHLVGGGDTITIATDEITGLMSAEAMAKLDGIEEGATAGAGDHATSHITGGDDIIPAAVAGGASGLMTGTDKTKLDGVEAGATVDQTAAEILALLLTVDGPGSGLNADLLDGSSSAAFQPIDSDLTTIAGLTATTDNVIQSVGSAWASRTPAQLKATLALAKGDVGLGNVDNTSDANKPVSTAGQTALDLKANLSVTANNQTGTTYTLVLGDAGKVIEANNASAVTLTVPTNASVAFPTGTVIEVWQQGAGQVTIAGAGVTFRAPGGLKTRVQYSTVSLRKQATDTWVVSGDSAT